MNWAQFIRDAATVSIAYNTYQANKKLDTLNESLDDFKNQTNAELAKLTATMQKGFSMLSMELAVQSQIFKNILNVLKEKRKTEAEELKKFGLKALRNGWISDAIDDFDKSIELNRYDYQVYYLLSKCYFLQDDKKTQDHYLQMAFQYSAEDPKFRQYIGLDIVGQLVKEKRFDEAKEVVRHLEGLLDGNLELTPLLMCKIYIDMYSANVDESTLVTIDKAIDNYEGDEPSRIITVVKALSQLLSNEQKSLIDNRLNLRKFAITKKYGANVLTYLDNIEKVLTYISTNSDKGSILKSAPETVVQRYFPMYNSIPTIIDRIRAFKHRISNITIDDYDKFSFVSPIIKKVEDGILSDIAKVYKKSEGGNFNSQPFEQTLEPELNFNVGQDDKILVQCKCNSGELITLTYFKLIIVDQNKNTFDYDLLNDFTGVEKEEIRTDEINVSGSKTDQITFHLRDKLSEKILLFSNSSYYTSSYGSSEKYANILNLLWGRAVNNILIYLSFGNFNNNLELLESCIDFIGLSTNNVTNTGTNSEPSGDVEFLESSGSDVEFLD